MENRRANSKRASQSASWSMRRRTTSHNVETVPKLLRSSNAKEMTDDNTPTVTARRRKLTRRMHLRRRPQKGFKCVIRRSRDRSCR
ncbi:hypothetical protein BDZ91DRAFT_715531 [Kalaharituber pfeilii]|nr:hypothetical protein BDZ91DRAFT_715531 [Kalaharituber pfeilii]